MNLGRLASAGTPLRQDSQTTASKTGPAAFGLVLGLALGAAAPLAAVTVTVSPSLVALGQGGISAPVSLRVMPGVSRQDALFTFQPVLPGALAGSVTVLPATIAVRVPAGAAFGAATFTVRAGPEARLGTWPVAFESSAVELEGFTLEIRASLTAPAGVTTAAVVFPSSGAQLAIDERVRPRGLLATSGTGTLIGTWRFDGHPFDRFAVQATAGLPLAIEARLPIPTPTLGTHRLELAIESPQRLVSEAVTVIGVTRRSSRLRLLAPEEGDEVLLAAARFRWTLVPGAIGYQVELRREGPATLPALRRTVGAPPWSPSLEDRSRLTFGEWRWRVIPLFAGAVEGEGSEERRLSLVERSAAVPWGIRLAALGPQEASSEPGAPPAEPTSPARQLLLSLEGHWNAGSATDQPDRQEADLNLSTQLGLTGPMSLAAGTVDLSVRRDLVAGTSPDPDRSWVLRGGRQGLESGGVAVAGVGLFGPELLLGSELVAAGLVTPGVEGTVGLAGLRLGYYQNLEPELAGLVSGSLAPEQEVRAAAVDFSGREGRLRLRALGLQVVEPAGELGPGKEGTVAGLLGELRLGPGLELVVEAARGEVTPGEGSFEPAQRGDAWRLGALGSRGAWTWGLTLRRSDAGFANPANPGLTAGGLGGRRHTELTLGRSFATVSAQGILRRVEEGASRLSGGDLAVSIPWGTGNSFSFAGNYSLTEAPGDPGFFLPASEQQSWGAQLAFAETLGSWSLTQTAGYQESRSRFDPGRFQAATTAQLGGHVALASWLSLDAQAQGLRSEAGDPATVTESLLVGLQPQLAWAERGLTLSSQICFDRTRMELAHTGLAGTEPASAELRNERYQLALGWNPAWLGSLVGFQVSADWSRSRSPGLEDARFLATYGFSLTLRRQHSAAAGTGGPAQPPGTLGG
ncbi:MAG TPA: hypothetical protein VF017_19235 [Thermoanaerobaculia bacterium]|nr:hypothetical protein [Thermoanaerobaculia bacterium]